MSAEAQIIRIAEIGLRMTLPPGYELQSFESVRQNREKAGLGEMGREASLPVLCAMRPPDDARNPMPTIQVVYRAKMGPLPCSLDQFLQMMTLAQSDVFEEFDFIDLPAAVNIAGTFGVARCTARYLLGYNQGHPLWVHVRFWLVQREDDIFMVSMSGPLEEEHLFADEFESAFRSADFSK